MLSPTPFRRGADMKRRDLISSALGITAGAAGLMFPGLPAIGSTLAGRSTVRPSAQVADPSFASGAVIAAFPTGLVIRSASGQRAIRTHAQTVTWKETFIPTGTIQLGDVVDVSGRPQMDESLLADRIWVNIVRFEGSLLAIRARAFEVRTRRNQVRELQLSPHIEVLGPDGAVQTRGVNTLHVGELIGGVGVRTRDGGVRATRVWTYR
jgi:hypothetical protein